MIFTFYSYKGGVGRSMALAGIAHILARRGLRVLVIDFDLEAPGLERYFFDGEGCRSIRSQLGLMDLLQSYQLALSDEAAFEKADFKRLDRFILSAVNVAGSRSGSVQLMTAGQREPQQKLREYALAVRSFDWQDFFHNWKGDLFFDWLRRQVTDPNPSIGYDVVLVDSRTGVTEMGGVCAYQLADVAILLCAPNYQNLEGTRDVVLDFRSDGVQALRQGRPLEILAIPARLEENHPKRDEFLNTFERELGVDGLPTILAANGLSYRKLALPYLKEFAVEERLVGDIGSQPTETVIKSFESLADAMTLLAKPASALAKQIPEALARIQGNAREDIVDLLADTTRTSAGYDVYIDYGLGDEGIVRELRAALESQGFRALSADTENVRPGAEWSVTLETAFKEIENLLVCFGNNTTSPFRENLLKKARESTRTRIIPVLLPGEDASSALRSLSLDVFQALDLRSWPNPEGLRRLTHMLKTRFNTQASLKTEPAGRDPYPGVKPYSEDDAGYFFGREEDLKYLLDVLKENEIVVLQGAAKVGKTSLVCAGLLPRLRDPAGVVDGLRCEGVRFVEADGDDVAALENLHRDLAKLNQSPSTNASPQVIIIDGIDSFTKIAMPEIRKARLGVLINLLNFAGPAFRYVLVWRGSLPEAERNEVLQKLALHDFITLTLEPLAGENLRRALEEPAKRAGHLLEPGLAERLIESAGSAKNAILQMQLVLAAIWPERRRGWLTNKTLDAAGHLNGIFVRHIQATLGQLEDDQRNAAVVLFKNLSQLNPNLDLVPQAQAWTWTETIPKLQKTDGYGLREKLADAGLIDLWYETTNPNTPLMITGVTLALTRANPLVYFGAETIPDSAFFMWRGQFITYVYHWLNRQQSSEALAAGNVLAEAEQWLALKHDELTEPERSFLHASMVAQQQASAELQRQKQLRTEQEFARFKADAQDRYQQKLAKARLWGFVIFVGAALLIGGWQMWKDFIYKKNLEDLNQAYLQNIEANSTRAVVPAYETRQENRVYMQVRSDKQKLAAKRIQDLLSQNHFNVSAIQTLATGPETTEVRYFRNGEADQAQKIAGLLQQNQVSKVSAKYIAGFENSKAILKGQFEIWFAADALAD